MRDLSVFADPAACLPADGGWGTELLNLGLTPGASPEQWNLLHPEQVLQIARSYVDAGASILLTNTFGGNSFRLSRHGLDGSLEEINRRGAEISREAAEGRAFVFGSIGPTGKMFALRKVNETEVFNTFRRQARALWDGGADAILIETMSELQELRIAARAARDACPLPLVLSMTFDSGPDKAHTMIGISPETAVEEMQKLEAWMVGANCGAGPESYVQVCSRMRAVTSKPIWVKPNAGMPAVEGSKIVYRQTPEIFGAYALQLRGAGANIIGGCCGTTPSHIRRLSSLLKGEPEQFDRATSGI